MATINFVSFFGASQLRRAFACAAIAAVLSILAACGGGDADEDQEAGANPLDCKARPELCK